MLENAFREERLSNFHGTRDATNAGGFLKSGQYINVGNVTNNRLHNTLISAAIQDTGTTVEDFGGVATGGLLEEILA